MSECTFATKNGTCGTETVYAWLGEPRCHQHSPKLDISYDDLEALNNYLRQQPTEKEEK
jgi:hypothetical protein